MPLEVSITTGGSIPIYRQITDQIRRAVTSGMLLPEEQLPSVRTLAEELVINPNTVARAYADLIRDGILGGQQGKGVFVAPRQPVYSRAERLRRLAPSLDSFINDGLTLGFSPVELRDALDRKLRAFTIVRQTGDNHV